MANKQKKSNSPIVYSTNPDYEQPGLQEEFKENIPNAAQKIRVVMNTKHRAGKVVTLITNFIADEEDQVALGKQLKTHCGTGGSVKDGEIIVQGDHRDKVLLWLHKNGYLLSKKG